MGAPEAPGKHPYEPPATTGALRPAVIGLLRLYCVVSAAAYLIFVAYWLFYPSFRGHADGPMTRGLVVGLVVMAAFYVVAAMIPYKPWGWVVGLLAIGVGLTGCFAPVAIGLLVYWLKPRTRAAFGRI